MVAVKLVSINTRGVPFWSRGFIERYRALAKALTDLDADIVQCQEVFTWRHWYLLRNQMRDLPYLGFQRSLLGPAGGLVTFSRKPLASTKYVRFRYVNEEAIKALPLRTRLTLGLHGVLSTVHQEAGTLLLNTHTSANSAGDWSPNSLFAGLHRSQLWHLAEMINTASGPVLMSGDLNTAADSVFYQEFRSQTETVDAFEDDDRPTFRPEFLPTGRNARRIDYILAAGSSPTVTDAELVLEEHPALSDHYGLQATVEWIEP